ncbi:broad-minded protein-domain-containing protein [Entophlyctis helioformis]|nr:broad-minded protein-domain-containing protein [Entophlyctis helioformis]
MDENFEKYAFVKNIRKRIDAFVGPILAEHLKSPAITSMPADNLVPSLVDKILASPEYAALSHRVTEDAKASIAALTDHLLQHKPAMADLYAPHASAAAAGRPPSHDPSFSAHSSATYESSSMGSISSGICPGLDELKHMFGKLHPGQTYENRMATVQRLASFSIGDMLADEFWPDSKKNMELALADPDTRIAFIGLRIYARAFKTAPPYMTPEVYLSFVSHLVHVFENTPLAKTTVGLDTRDPRVELTLKKFRLLHQFMMEIPSLWFRFPEQVFKDVMTLSFRLIRSPRKHVGTLTPLHYLAIIDPRSTWFEKWMMSNLGRAHVVAAMQRNETIVDLANAFVHFAIGLCGVEGGAAHDELLVEDVDVNDDGDVGSFIHRGDLEYTHFLHVVVMIARVSLSAAGRRYFPVRIEDSALVQSSALAPLLRVPEIDGQSPTAKYELSLRSFIMILIRQMASKATLSNATGEYPSVSDRDVVDSFSMSRFMSRILKTIAAADSQCREELYKDNVLRELMRPVRLALDGRAGLAEETGLLAVAEALSDIAATDSGRTFILRGETQYRNPDFNAMTAVRSGSNDVIDTIATFVKQSLRGEMRAVGAGAGASSSGVGAAASSVASVAASGGAGVSASAGGLVSAPAVSSSALPGSGVGGGAPASVSGIVSTAQSSATAASSTPSAATGPGLASSSTSSSIVAASGAAAVAVARRVVGGYIFFLRQLYRSCEGLLWLEKHDLHTTLAMYRSTTARGESDREWNAMLIDNLLNFAATPKGVMLLRQTGAMEPCVAYMFQRYQKKLQVSKCEKFGYGTLVSQISTTPAGTEALWKTGLVHSFIHDMWSHLSCDRPLAQLHPDIDEYSFNKTVSNVLKIFVSFPAVATCLRLDPPDATADRNTLSYLVRKLVTVDAQVDCDWIVSFDDGHQVGLRVLRLVSCSSLDSMILLQVTFRVQESLMQLQQESHIQTVEGGHAATFVVDENSLLRNHILLATLTVGGAGERSLPPITVPIDGSTFDVRSIPVFDGRSIPPGVLTQVDKAAYRDESGSVNAALSQLVSSAQGLQAAGIDRWLKDTRDAFTACLDANESGCVPLPLSKRLVGALSDVCGRMGKETAATMGLTELVPRRSGDAGRVASNTSAAEIPPGHKLGIALAARYATRFLAIDRATAYARLESLFHLCRSAFYPASPKPPAAAPAKKDVKSGSASAPAPFTGFDWFAATLFILCDGDTATVMGLLTAIHGRMMSVFIWSRPPLSWDDEQEKRYQLLVPTCCHLVEAILETELPMVSSAFTLSGCTPTQMVQRWLRECYWNVLPLSEISNVTLGSLLHGPDTQIYVAISLIRHARSLFLAAARDCDLIGLMARGDLIGDGYSYAASREYLAVLGERYSEMVWTEMRGACGIHRE